MKHSKQVTLAITLAIALAIVGTMGTLAFYVGANTPSDHYINVAILLTSIAVGWLVGTFISPDSKTEDERFSRYGTAIKAFASGYLVSKSDKLMTAIFDPDTLFKDVPQFRFLICLSGFVVATMVTYILREYVLDSLDDEQTDNLQLPPLTPKTNQGDKEGERGASHD